MIEFIARVRCDNAPCTETAELGVSGTVNNDRCNYAGCGCVPGELEVDHGLTPFAERWSDFGDGRIFCPACSKDMFRFEAVSP